MEFLRQRRTWSTQVVTLLDGDLRLRAICPGGGADDVALLRATDGPPCPRGTLGRVPVTRGGATAWFTLQVQAP